MKKKYWLNGIAGFILLLVNLQASANILDYQINQHTISINDNNAHTLLEARPFTTASTFKNGGYGTVLVLFNAECNIESNQSGVWFGIKVQIRNQVFDISSNVWGDWSDWYRTNYFPSSDNDALCSSHGSDAPVIRVSASRNHPMLFNSSTPFVKYQIRIQGRLRDGVGRVSIDDSSLVLLN